MAIIYHKFTNHVKVVQSSFWKEKIHGLIKNLNFGES